jgi:N,N'-diacetyllegionaminate synthase
MGFFEELGTLPYYVIAEAADAHYGNLDRARSMIVAAKSAGANAIKFQHHIPDAEMLRDTPLSSNMAEPLYDFLVRNALKIEQHVELNKFCEEIGIQYLCTPFSLKAAQELEESISPIAYKIGSGELLDHPTLLEIAKFGKCMILSTGMSTVDEIQSSYQLLENHSSGLVLMNCTSAYPPKYSDIHVSFTREMLDLFPKAIIGFSDHSPGLETSLAAFTLGARVIEKHVTISHDLSGPDSEVSIGFDELETLIHMMGNLSLALKAKKEIHESELEIRNWAHRSLVFMRDMKAGEVIEYGDIWGKRPGTGVPSRNMSEFLGKKLVHDVCLNDFVTYLSIGSR